MPRSKKTKMPRRPRRKGGKRGSSMPLIAEKAQSARIVETIEFQDLSGNQSYNQVFTLGQFPRADGLSRNFAWYRAKRVIYSYEPLFNTFQDAPGSASKPYMYVLMNRSQQLLTGLASSTAQFQAAGARPQALISTKRISYKPNWCSPGLLSVRSTTSGGGVVLTDYAGVGQQAQFGWLATPPGATITPAGGHAIDQFVNNVAIANPAPTTNPFSTAGQMTNMTIYNGHLVHFDQKIPGDNNNEPVCRCTISVEWEFKGAKNPLANPPPAAAVVETLPPP